MVTIELTFVAGRFHATPWNRHVNEGDIEWPPSPWRLLRALVATWHLKAQSDIDAEHIAALVEKLGSALPSYLLPNATASHTRHYMPLYHPTKTTKVFDTFVHLDRGATMHVTWPTVMLEDDLLGFLELLLSRVGYIGRAESWAEARLVPVGSESTLPPNAYPLEEAAERDDSCEIVRLLAPMPQRALRDWSSREFERALARALAAKQQKARTKGKDMASAVLSAADKRRAQAGLPTTVLGALCVETGDLQRAGWSGVPGAQWIDYVRPRGAFGVTSPHKPSRNVAQHPTVARFALASQVPPHLTEGVFLAERLRKALMGLSDGAPVFSGKQRDGSPSRGHRHAFIMPEANGDHGRITHVTLFAPMGFDKTACDALQRLRTLWKRDGNHLQMILIGMGEPGNFAGRNVRAGQCPLLDESADWVSRTPFITTRHPKVIGGGRPRLDNSGLQVGSLEHELRRLLKEANLPSPLEVRSVDGGLLGGKHTSWRDFETTRREAHGRRGPGLPAGFRLQFPCPVRGPIALGYGAHFGLGAYVPAGTY